uniref:Uncharacterized protein n=1 Tax=Oryza sativa subsp. japonica TaxID=39947 RepID=Q6KAI4_ORYSJ|nr:hypothetical protein [Oryza sativa Japonica Group]
MCSFSDGEKLHLSRFSDAKSQTSSSKARMMASSWVLLQQCSVNALAILWIIPLNGIRQQEGLNFKSLQQYKSHVLFDLFAERKWDTLRLCLDLGV